jgi:hypothetical protein
MRGFTEVADGIQRQRKPVEDLRIAGVDLADLFEQGDRFAVIPRLLQARRGDEPIGRLVVRMKRRAERRAEEDRPRVPSRICYPIAGKASPSIIGRSPLALSL